MSTKTEPMTDEQIDALRASMPDIPVKRPDDRLACASCGVGVGVTPDMEVVYVERLGSGGTYISPLTVPGQPPQRMLAPVPNAVPLARCASCRSIAEEAAAYVAEHPELEAREGNIITERVEQALLALSVIGRPRPPEAVWEAVWPRMFAAASRLRWSNPSTLAPKAMNGRAWAHVSLGQREELRTAYVQGLHERVVRTQAPLAVPAPSGTACLFCGVLAVRRSAVEVERLGGVRAASAHLWDALVTSPASLGGRGPDLVQGWVCPPCTEAVDDAGAVGLLARGQAVVNHLQATGAQAKARRLANLLEDDVPPYLPAWAATQQPPSASPWAHLAPLFARL